MNDGLQVRIVEIENVGADAVHQRRIQNVHTFPAAKHGRLRGAGERRQSAPMAMSTVSCRDPPTAQPTQFRSVRVPSCRTLCGRS